MDCVLVHNSKEGLVWLELRRDGRGDEAGKEEDDDKRDKHQDK